MLSAVEHSGTEAARMILHMVGYFFLIVIGWPVIIWAFTAK